MVRARASIAAAAAALLLAGCRARSGSQGVEATWGLDVLAGILADQRNIVIPAVSCKLQGFTEDVSEYRVPSIRRRGANGVVTAAAPASGTFYPGFIFYDSAAEERVEVRIGGFWRGIAVADADDNRQYLFFLTEPYTFKGGETLELRALGSTGAYRTESLVLLKQKPQPRKHVYEFTSVRGEPDIARARASARITWVSNWPVACTVEWRGASSGKIQETLALNNHRVVIEDLRPSASYEFRIEARNREGGTVSTAWKAFRTEAPVPRPGSIARDRISLKVLGPAQPGFPLTSGLPFPKGALGSDGHLRLLDAQGGEVPLQAETLAKWQDGSVKWALLDFQPSSTSYTLEYGSQVRRGEAPSALQIAEDAAAVTVDTGPLRFTISKTQFGFLESAWLNGAQVIWPAERGAFYLTGPGGTSYTSIARPEEVVLEERGPLRAVVRVRGTHQAADGRKLFGYTVRVHAYAGQSFLRVQHTVVNDSGEAAFTTIRSLSLRLPLTGVGAKRRWQIEGASGELAPEGKVELKQLTDDSYSIAVDGKPAGAGKRASGWAEWSDGLRSVTLAVRDFWQNYPKGLMVSPGGLALELCPPLGSGQYAAAAGTLDEHRLYYYLQDGGYKLPQGLAKTHDIWLDFEKAGPPARVRDLRSALIAAAPAEWYARSKAFGELSVPQPTGILQEYDAAFARSFAEFLKNREANREYGMLNFGDWWGERIINWGNSEYDTQHSFLLQFVRTGDPRYFRAGEEVELHNRDVDTVHWSSEPQRAGGVWAHAIGHTGGYYTRRPTGGAPPGGFRAGSPESHMAADHTFVEGHVDYYFLAGDRASLETARSIVDRYDGYYTRNYDFNNCRQPGWQLIMSMALYNATYDPFYLNGARIIVERVLERQTPDGGWKRQLVPGHCYCTPRHMGNAGFMVGVLLTGLKRFHEVTGDERVASAIVKGAHFLINDMWVPEIHGFRYTSCPKSNTGPSYNFRLFDGIVYAHQRTGDAGLERVLLDGTGPAIKSMQGQGKGFTQQTRVTPHFIDYLVELKKKAR